MESTSAPSSSVRQASLAPTLAVGAAFLVVAAIFLSTSSWYFAFKTVHVVGAVVWIGGGLLLTILALIAERRNDPVEMATIARQAAYVGERVFVPASLVVLVMGIAMMLNTDWGWGHFWIVFGLLGFASTFTIGIGFLSPLAKRIVAAMEESGPHSPEAQALITRILLIARVDTAILLLVIVDMVAKPFS
jgi:uncharacterized membrane protein